MRRKIEIKTGFEIRGRRDETCRQFSRIEPLSLRQGFLPYHHEKWR